MAQLKFRNKQSKLNFHWKWHKKEKKISNHNKRNLE